MTQNSLSTYVPTGKLGQTNCAVLFEGRDQTSDRDVVIMELHPQFKSVPERWGAVWNDVQKAFSASLENIVERNALESDGRIIVQMVAGNLKDRLQAEKKVSPEIVRSAIRRTLHALSSYEEAGIIHGCVKPASLLHNNEDFIKLSFSPGLKLGGQIAHPGCDYQYMAPELIDADFGDVGPGVDLYALGMTAMELLLGKDFNRKVPGASSLTSADDEGWTGWHISKDLAVPAFAEMLPSVPPDLARVIDGLTRRQVSDRYPNAAAALEDLDEGADIRLSVQEDSSVSRPVVPSHSATPGPPNPPGGTEKLQRLVDDLKNQLGDRKNRPLIIGTAIILFIAMFFALSDSATMVEFKTDPKGATIVVDGRKYMQGVTPQTLPLDAGEHKLEFRLDGYKVLKETFIARDGETTPVHRTLVAQSRKPGNPDPELPKDEFALPDGVGTPAKPEIHPELKIPYRVFATRMEGSGQRLELALIEPGEYQYGVNHSQVQEILTGELTADPNDPAVVPQPFYISITEVSAGQYNHFLSEASADGNPIAGNPELPAVGVSFDQALSFCEWLSPAGALPDEVEWEVAASGGQRQFPWPDNAIPDASRCNLQFDRLQKRTLLPVNSMTDSATPQGLLHVLGNAAEWCDTLYVAGHDEEDGDPGVGAWPVIRGGSYREFFRRPYEARVTHRANSSPEGDVDIGFRVVVRIEK